ncbi:IPT/TIG domain-containing protein [Mucilaginibacter sp. HD30]
MKILNKYPLTFTTLLLSGVLFTAGCKKYKEPLPDNTVTIDDTPVVTGMIGGNYGPPNSGFIVTGRNFSKNFKESKIMFGNLTADAIAGDDTYISVIVPDYAVAGGYGITVITKGKSMVVQGMGFRVEEPIPKLSEYLHPTGAMRGAKMTIYGTAFSTNKTRNKVSLNGAPIVIDSVNTGAVYITIPANATSGELLLTTYDNKVLSYEKNFKIFSSSFTSVGTGSAALKHISVDAAGNIYGVDYNTVVKVTPGGVSTILATIGSTDTFVLGSTAVDAAGNVYVSSGTSYGRSGKFEPTDNSFKIFKITPGGTLSVFAGSTQGFADATGTAAKFMSPTSLAIDQSTGNLYVNDAKVIRKITPAGVVTTFAGHNMFSGYNDVMVNGLIQYDGQGVAALFVDIIAMTFDVKTNTLYIADSGARTFRKATAAGLVTSLTLTPEGGLNSNNLNINPSATNNMGVDGTGVVYIGTGRDVFKVKDGVSSNTYLNPSGGVDIFGLTVSNEGNIYVSGYKSFPVVTPSTFAVYKIAP